MLNKSYFHYILISLIAIVFYAQTFNYGYVLDDFIVITGNNYTLKGVDGFYDIFSNDAFKGAYGEQLDLTGGRYRPLSIFTFALGYDMWGLNPMPEHIINVLLFALTGILIYIFIRKIDSENNYWLALITAVLFVSHPIHTEVVANIKSRDEILVLIFGLLTLYFILSKSRFSFYLSLITFIFGIFSKENFITLIAIIPIVLYLFSNYSNKEIIFKSSVFLGITILFLILRNNLVGIVGDKGATQLIDNPYLLASFNEKTATIFYTLGKYIQLLFYPHPLSSDYSFNSIPLINWTSFKAIFSLLLNISLFIYGIYLIVKKKHKVIAFGILFYFITLSIASNLVFNIGTSMGERFIYLSSFGFCIAIASLFQTYFKFLSQKSIEFNFKWILPVLLIVIIFFNKTYSRNKAWESNYTLYKTDSKIVPNSARVRLFYGIELINRYDKYKNIEDINKAISEITVAAQIEPNFFHSHYNLGVAYQKIENYDMAIKSFTRVLEIQPYHIQSTVELGVCYGKGKGDAKNAIFYLKKAIFEYKQNKPEYYDYLGISYSLNGEFEKSINTFSEGIKMYPESASLYRNLAVTYYNINQPDKGDFYINKAKLLDPNIK